MNVAVPTNILSLAAGGGGLDLGVGLALPGARTVCYVENEVSAAAVLASNMEAGRLPAAPIWTDLRTFDGRGWRGIVDGVIGGYPCQPFSVAGKQRGADDPRHLWPYISAIVADVQPRWCFFENVANHLRLGFREVARDLHEMGYRVAATLWRAEEVGAPHRRERLFILAMADSDKGGWRTDQRDLRTRKPDARWGGAAVAIPDEQYDDGGRNSGQGWRPESANRGRAVGDVHEQGPQGRRGPLTGGPNQRPAWPPGPTDFEGWADVVTAGHVGLLPATPQPTVRGVADGLAGGLGRADQLRILGNGVVPQQAAAAFRELWAELNA